MIWIAAAFMLLAALVGAKLEGEADGARSLTGDTVEHKFSATIRVVAGVALAVLVTALSNAPWWTVLPMLGIAFGGFNMLFRLTLNRRRKLDWRYVSPSNVYDSFFLKLAWGRAALIAGTLAYLFELAVLLASTILLILTTNT